MSRRWTRVLVLWAAACAAAPGRGEEPLVEPIFVDGVMPPGAPGVTLGVALPTRAATLQLDVPLGPRAGGSLLVAAQARRGGGPPDLMTPGGRLKVVVLEAAEGRPGLVAGVALAPAASGPGEVSAALGVVHLASPFTLEATLGLSSSTEAYQPEVLLGAAAGLALGPRLRFLLELAGELGPTGDDRALYLGPVLGVQLGPSTALYAGCLAGFLAGADPLQAMVQLKQDL